MRCLSRVVLPASRSTSFPSARANGLRIWSISGQHAALQCRAQVRLGQRNYVQDFHRGVKLSSSPEPTIYALSTAPGRAAIAIIRCSGTECINIYNAICPDVPIPRPRYASLRTLFSPHASWPDRQVLDLSALVLYFPGPFTVTGEDVVEFHVHGGPAVVKSVLAAISNAVESSPGRPLRVRYAEPGEFTRRAFYNNRLTIPQIEALGDVLSAETEQQRRLAVRGSSASLAARYESWRRKLLYARGELEALIDFSEDQHFEESPTKLISSVAGQVAQLQVQLQASIENASRGELLRNGINIALLGAPNAGKSSLLNRIVGRAAAIVSREAGTTRDVVDINVDIGGFFCKLGDLAGLRGLSVTRETAKAEGTAHAIGEVEAEGIRRAKERVFQADVVIVVLPVEKQESSSAYAVQVTPDVADTLSECNPETQNIVLVVNKIDLLPPGHVLDTTAAEALMQYARSTQLLRISCKESLTAESQDSTGIQALLTALIQTFQSMTTPLGLDIPSSASTSQPWEESLGTSERQRLLLLQCQHQLDAFLQNVATTLPDNDTTNSRPDDVRDENGGVDPDIDIVLAAESLRDAAECLARLTGRDGAGDVEEVLGVVFEKFCVGK